MFEQVVSKFMKSYVAEYFSNFDASKLEISLYKGHVSLSDLHLCSSALDSLNLPYTVVAGSVGKLTLQVSWTKLLSSPLVARIEDVYILLAPGTEHDFDEAEAEKLKQATKQRLLEAWSDKQQQSSESAKAEADLYSNKSVFSLVNNLQLSIGNIHIRLEDSGVSTGMTPFAMGVTLKGISATSADEHWKQCSMGTSKTQARKLLNLDGFGTYCETNVPKEKLLTLEDEAQSIKGLAASLQTSNEYLLQPVSCSGRVAVNKRVENMSEPQHDVSLQLKSCGLVLNSNQYLMLLKFADYTSWLSLRESWKPMRPKVPIAKNRRVWWQFAVDAALVDFRRRTKPWSWSFMKNRRDQRQQYVALFRKQLSDTITKEEKLKLTKLQEKLELADIILYRRIAKAKAKAHNDASPRGGGWFGGWFGGSSAQQKDEDLERAQQQLVTLLEDEADFESVESKEFVAFRMNVELHSASITLEDSGVGGEPNTTFFSLASQDTSLEILQRPAAEAVKAHVAVESFSLQTLGQGGQLRDAITRPQADRAVLDLVFETAPMVTGPVKPDMRVSLALLPLEIQLVLSDLLRVQSFFEVPDDVFLNDLTGLVESAVESVKSQTRAGLEYAVETRKTADIAVAVTAPLLVLLETEDPSSRCLVVDPGSLTLKSDLSNQAELPNAREATLEELEELAYNRYKINLVNIQVLVAHHDEDWRSSLKQSASPHHLLSKLKAEADLRQCLRPKDIKLPQFKLLADVACLDLCVSNRNLERLTAFANALPSEPAKEQPVIDHSMRRTDSLKRMDAFEPAFEKLDILDERDAVEGSTAASADDDDLEGVSSDDDDEFVDAEEYQEDEKPSSAAVQQRRASKLALHNVFVGHFTVQRLAVMLQVYDAGTGQTKPGLTLRFQELSSTVVARSFDMTVTGNLKGLFIEDHQTKCAVAEGKPFYLVHTCKSGSLRIVGSEDTQAVAGEEQFISINYHYAQPRSPVFGSMFESTESKAELTAAHLCVAAHQGALAGLAKFIDQFQSSMAASASEEPTTVATTQAVEAATTVQAAKVVQLVGRFEFKALAIELFVDRGLLAQFLVANVVSEMIQYADRMEVTAALGELKVTDFSINDEATRQILSMPSKQEWLRTDVVLFNEPTPDDRLSGTITADVGKMQVMFRMQFVSELLAFVEPVQAAFAALSLPDSSSASTSPESSAASLTSSSRASTSAPSKTKDGAPANSPRWYLKVCLLAPTIIAPQSSFSRSAFAFDLGAIRVSNSFSEQDETVSQTFAVELTDTKATRCDMTTGEDGFLVLNNHSTILQMAKTNIAAVLAEPLEGTVRPPDFVDTSVSVALGKFSVTLKHTDYALALSFLSGNLAETPSFATSQDLVPASTGGSATEANTQPQDSIVIAGPSGSAMDVTATWEELELKLLDDKHSKPTEFSFMKISGVSAAIKQDPHRSELMDLDFRLRKIEIQNTRTHEGQVNAFPNIFGRTEGSNSDSAGDESLQDLVTVKLQQTRKAIWVVAPTAGDKQQVSIDLLLAHCRVTPWETGTATTPEQKAAGLTTFVLLFNDADDALVSLSEISEQKQALELVDVGWAPPTNTKAAVVIQDATIRVEPSFLVDMANFFALQTPAIESGDNREANASDATSSATTSAAAATIQPATITTPEGKTVTYGDAMSQLSAGIELHEAKLLIVENEFDPSSHVLELAVDIEAMYTDEDNVQTSLLSLRDVAVCSYDMGVSKTRLDVVPSMTLSMKYTTAPQQVKADVFSGPIAVNLAYRDVASVLKILDALSANQDQRSSAPGSSWDQHTFAAPKRTAESTEQGDDETEAVQEVALINVPAINVTLVNNLSWRQTPLMVFSLNLEATVKDWSSSLDTAAFVKLAAATYSPAKSSFEPLLLGAANEGDSAADQRVIHPVPIMVTAHNQMEPRWILPEAIVAESGHGNAASSHGKGGSADVLLKPQPDAFWDCGSTKAHSWIIMDIGRPALVSKFLYELHPDCDARPGQGLIEVGETAKGPWRKCAILLADQEPHDVDGRPSFESPEFSVVGRWLKWTFKPASGKHAAWISSVRLEQQATGLSTHVRADRQLDLTITSEWLTDVQTVMAAWMGEQKTRPESKECAAVGVGSHKLVNLTGHALALTPSKLFTPARRQPIVLQDGKEHFFNLQPDWQAAPLTEMSFIDRSVEPITDVIIISPSRGQVPPEGYQVVPKDLNLGSGLGNTHESVLFLCYTRSKKFQPITDLHVAYGGPSDKKKGIYEPTPEGFTRLPEDLNAGGGGRSIHLCFRRDSAVPIVGLAVVYQSRGSVPADFVRINTDTNKGRHGTESVFVAFRRQPCKPNDAYEPDADTVPPIVELAAVVHNSFAKANALHLMDGSNTGLRWQNCYNGESKPRNMNRGAGGKDVIFLHRRDRGAGPAVTMMKWVKDQPITEPGWSTVRDTLTNQPANFNDGTSGRKLYLQYRRDVGASPVIDIRFVNANEAIPEGYHFLRTSVNTENRGKDSYICYKLGNLPKGACVPAAEDAVCAQVVEEPRQDAHHLIETGCKELLALQLLSRDHVSLPLVSFEVEGWQPVERVNIDQHAEQLFIMEHRHDAGRKCRVVVHTELQEDLKIVTVRSPLVLKNTLPIPLQVSLHNSSEDKMLEGGKEWAVPLEILDLPEPSEDMLPLFRFWSQHSQTHFYTTDPLDVGELNAMDMVHEAILGYVFKTQRQGTVPLWASRPCLTWSRDQQSFSAFADTHSQSESWLLTRGYETIGYVYSAAIEGKTVPLYRYHNARSRDFLLTVNEHEVGTLNPKDKGKHNYTFKQLECHLLQHPGMIRVRPAGGSHGDSIEKVDLQCSQAPAQRLLVCPPGKGHDFASVGVHVTQKFAMSWELEPSVFVHNCLPTRLAFEVSHVDFSKTPSQPRFAAPFGQPNDNVGIFDVQVDKVLYLRVALPSSDDDRPEPSRWSEGVAVRVANKPTDLAVELRSALGSQCTAQLRVSLRRKYDSHGPLQIQVYSPFVVVNDSGMSTLTMEPVQGTGAYVPVGALSKEGGEEETSDTETLQAFFAPSKATTEAVLVHGDYRSKPFALQGVLSELIVRTYLQQSDEPKVEKDAAEADYQFVLTWVPHSDGPNGSPWRQFTIKAPITLVNNSNETLVVSQDTAMLTAQPLWEPRTMPSELQLAPAQTVRITKATKQSSLLRVRRSDSLWSSALHIKKCASRNILKMAQAETGAFLAQELRVSRRGRCVHGVFTSNTDKPPYQVENHSRETAIEFWQRGCSQRYRLDPGEAMAFALDDPSDPSKGAICIVAADVQAQRDPASVKLQPGIPVQAQYTKPGGPLTMFVAASVVGEDDTLHVLIADDVISMRSAWGLPPKEDAEKPVMNLSLGLDDGVGISVVNSRPADSGHPYEFVYLHVGGVNIQMTQTTAYESVSGNIESVHIDHQREGCLYPVVINQIDEEENRAVLNFCQIVKKGQLGATDRSGDSVEYMSVLLQPLNVHVDGMFIKDALQFMEYLPEAAEPADDVPPEVPRYYDKIEIQPIELVITLSNMDSSGIGEGTAGTFGIALLNLNEATMRLNAVFLEKVAPITTTELSKKLTDELTSRVYHWMAKSGLVSTLGSLEALGDPLGSFKTLGAGVKDFFYEPAKGIVKGPGEFSKGVGKGTKKLASAFVGTVSGASSKITGAVGSASAALTFDEDFAKDRAARLASAKARGGFGSGLRTGFSQLGHSLAGGFSGVVMQPIKGGREDGFLGGIKGVGKGLSGLVTKPVSGVVDMFSATLAGIESEVSGKAKLRRARLPRHISITQVIDPFFTVKAWGQSFIKQNPAFKSEYADLIYVSHVVEQTAEGTFRFFFFTNKLIVVVTCGDNLKDPSINLEIASRQVAGYRALETGMEVLLDDTSMLLLPSEEADVRVSLARDLSALMSLQHRKALEGKVQYFFGQSGKAAEQAEGTTATPAHLQKQVEIWENQRKYSGTWIDKLKSSERPPWSSRDGRVTLSKSHFPLDAGWDFVDDWKVDMTGFPCDREGWQYAGDFSTPASFVNKQSYLTSVRRRRWVRTAAGPASATSTEV
eukprot:m.322117 g.322117  ORF g.322117 m.322117 type:complete len:4041 (-) comp19714_c0_seq2:110-12232(-)